MRLSQKRQKYYELAALWELRLALRSGDIYVDHARRYADPNTYLIPDGTWPEKRQEVVRLTSTPPTGETRLQEREAQLRQLAERIEESHIKEVVVTDTVPLPAEKQSPKIVQLSVAPLFAQAIERIHTGESVSSIFE